MTTNQPPSRSRCQVGLGSPGLDRGSSPQGDALPSTHTRPTATPARKVTDRFANRLPLPFPAKQIPARAIASTMRGCAVAVTILAVLAMDFGDTVSRDTTVLLLSASTLWCCWLALPTALQRAGLSTGHTTNAPPRKAPDPTDHNGGVVR